MLNIFYFQLKWVSDSGEQSSPAVSPDEMDLVLGPGSTVSSMPTFLFHGPELWVQGKFLHPKFNLIAIESHRKIN